MLYEVITITRLVTTALAERPNETGYTISPNDHSNYVHGHMQGALGASGMVGTIAQVNVPGMGREEITTILRRLTWTLEDRQSRCNCSSIAPNTSDPSYNFV